MDLAFDYQKFMLMDILHISYEDAENMQFLTFIKAIDYSMKVFTCRNMAIDTSKGSGGKGKGRQIDWSNLNPVAQALKTPKYFSEIPERKK